MRGQPPTAARANCVARRWQGHWLVTYFARARPLVSRRARPRAPLARWPRSRRRGGLDYLVGCACLAFVRIRVRSQARPPEVGAMLPAEERLWPACALVAICFGPQVRDCSLSTSTHRPRAILPRLCVTSEWSVDPAAGIRRLGFLFAPCVAVVRLPARGKVARGIL